MNLQRVTQELLIHAVTEIWWETCSLAERAYWMKRAQSASHADAYACMQREMSPNYCRICTPAGFGHCRCENRKQ